MDTYQVHAKQIDGHLKWGKQNLHL
jgi:hypothetical protein